ncbi:PREDICTED: uncharacterized protein LOC104824967 [Tarenaya hassleriana]|uniref:uncharacterized protein LOC104824967 n=1 Tax=Tarenaya hassleriana TaxID=28532 RepID=UPI00053C7BC0|nr:PREDICTED: uncharacterized protein LOC104824967 [Tarenaya hassleriana]
MDFTTSPYSGGGDSGWTMYLEQSYVSATQNDVGYGFYGRAEEEDLSMVSDASSGPHRCNLYDRDCYYQENNDNGFSLSGSSSCESSMKKTTKKKKNDMSKDQPECYGGGNSNQMYSCLDDTASSDMHVFSSEKGYSAYGEDVSEGDTLGFSETKSKGKSGFRKHLRFFQPSVPEKPESEGKGNGTQRRKRG